jgi:predicted nucleic acid-binding protein
VRRRHGPRWRLAIILVDTSVWIAVLADARKRGELEAVLAGEAPVLHRFTQLELLAGCRDQRQWDLLAHYLAVQDYVDADAETWQEAARLHFELRSRGRTAADLVDCCVAQLAIGHGALLLHRDRGFETIATLRNLRQRRLRL